MNPEDKLLRPVEEHELKKKSRVWKYFWGFVGLILLFLVLSYMLTGYTVRPIIAGKFDSEKIDGSIIETEYGKVIFKQEVYEELEKLYYQNEKEFKACLLGEYKNQEYLVEELFLPKVYFQDYDQVVSSNCPEKTLLDLHSHPQQHCTFSEQDLKGFMPVKEITLLTVMCGDGRFIFFEKAI